MKKLFKLIITAVLKARAKAFLKKHRVQIIAITGSVGKTSTKEALYHILKKRFNVHSSKKSFNTEIGLSLAVLREEESGFRSVAAWLRILRRALFSVPQPYHKIVLEMGADKPGDIKKLMAIAPPRVSVVTAVQPVHLGEGQFKDIKAIAKEKGTLVRGLPKAGLAVLNADDARVQAMESPAPKVIYGLSKSADLQARNVNATSKHLSFEVSYGSETEKFTVPLLGEFQVYVCLPAIAVALKMGMNLKECADALSDFSLPPGRMNPIPGIHKSQIIDSSYNASPTAIHSALGFLRQLKAKRKIAALGMMNELGDRSEEAHIQAGRQAAQAADLLIFVGQEAPTYKKGALAAGKSENAIFTFFDSEEAGKFLAGKLEAGDLVLVKGSQNKVRMEKLVKLIMKEPDQAESLLCRQGTDWNKF
jgi:UDP-N-acetylmuramyl pentapeptide synthase